MIRFNENVNDIQKEIEDIASFPEDMFVNLIREVGFECDLCGKCCTNAFNDHVFLLDEDTSRIIRFCGKAVLDPAPYPDFCDNFGRFYVMGYALKGKTGGNCIFYTNGKCEHYEIRPSICRIYPYMLHREGDEKNNIEFRQISGLNEHGIYYNDMDDATCQKIFESVKKYEIGFLEQKIGFLNTIKDYFGKNNLRHSRQMYDRKMKEFQKGEDIEFNVFFNGTFEKEIVSSYIINY